MINKKFIHFNKNEVFNEKLTNGEILNSSIVFIKDSNKMYTQETSYSWVNWDSKIVDVPENYDLYFAKDMCFEASDGYLFVKSV